MWQRNVYYHLKPFIPWRLRIAMRATMARKKRARYSNVWPINEAAGETPAGWPGWPDGKKFSFVLTHDVEGPDGVRKCRQLAELEMEHGFRSSFNFIPAGTYSVPDELREWLVANGFEVGVHDLHHDGKLFSSRRSFRHSARLINEHLKKWNAVGYRCGFMLHNLDWQRDLDILYDASTFDVDPFEPQPDGVQTIFPFRVAGDGNRKGFVEMPYTLVQDSTLFFLLRETSPAIWIKKLEWIVRKGGMALLNVHPDYLGFDDRARQSHEFPVKHYADFLKHVRDYHGDTGWHATARDVALYARDHTPEVDPRPKRRVCMITYSRYENDNRVRRYAETLARRGDHVEILAVPNRDNAPRDEVLEGVNITHLTQKVHLRSSLFTYFFSVARFTWQAFVCLTGRAFKHRYDVVHVHNMPDFVVIAALLPRLRGARIILDLHDLVPELYAEKMGGWRRRLASSILRWEERLSAMFSHHVIVSNHLWLDTIIERSAPREACSVFVNNVDEKIFFPRTRTRTDDRRIILFHGSVSHHQGCDLVVRAMPQVRARVPNAEFHVIGGGSEIEGIKRLIAELGVGDAVRILPGVPLQQIPQIVADADVGVVAKRADSFGNRAYSTKILEFMSQGTPVVLSRTEIDSFYFDDSVARFFPSGDVDALAQGLIDVLTDDALRQRLVQNAHAYVVKNCWSSRSRSYLGLVDGIIDGAAAPAL